MWAYLGCNLLGKKKKLSYLIIKINNKNNRIRFIISKHLGSSK